MITSFTGKYRFLSNFWPVCIEGEGLTYPSVEHAYQAFKSLNPEVRSFILLSPTASIAKKRGKLIELREDWDEVKLKYMREFLCQKFSNPKLSFLLFDTGNEELVEGNYWGDTYWGQCPIGTGENHLGKLLMQVRSELT